MRVAHASVDLILPTDTQFSIYISSHRPFDQLASCSKPQAFQPACDQSDDAPWRFDSMRSSRQGDQMENLNSRRRREPSR